MTVADHDRAGLGHAEGTETGSLGSPSMDGVLIEERLPLDDDLSELLAAAFSELVDRYGSEGRSAVHPDARYLVAVVEGRTVGCGAIQPAAPGTAELKRMYVTPSSRGQGIALALLAGLEDWRVALATRR